MSRDVPDLAFVRLFAQFLQTFAFLWDRDRKPYRVSLVWSEDFPARERAERFACWRIRDLESPSVVVEVATDRCTWAVLESVLEAFERILVVREGVSPWEASQRLDDLGVAFARCQGDPMRLLARTDELAQRFFPPDLLLEAWAEDQDLDQLAASCSGG